MAQLKHTKAEPAGTIRLLAGFLAGSCVISVALAQGTAGTATAAMDHAHHAAPIQTAALSGLPGTKPPPQLSATEWRARNGLYYKRNWGVEVVGVKPVSSGYMLEFRYRILDPDKAKMLNDMKERAYVIDDATGTRLAVPAMENIGELRSGAAPKIDRTYFMIFGNPGKLVKPGSRIDVVVGNFRVDNLIVD